MFYPHQQSSGGSASKHHDGNGDPSRLGGGGGGGGGGGWGRHPSSFTPTGMPMPSPGGYPGLGGGVSGYGAPPPGAGGHHHVHLHGGHGQHHPSFGSGAGGAAGAGLHLGVGGQNGGMGVGAHGPAGYGGLGMFGSGAGGQQNSPPRGGSEPVIPLTPHWVDQLKRADSSRQSSSPHHRARAAAISSRATAKPAAVSIIDPNNRPTSSQANGIHRKNTSSLSVANNAADRALTPPLSEASTTPATNNGEPVSLQPPAPNADKDEDRTSEPWTGLDLGGIRLRTLSKALFSFTHITSLYINHNTITTLPSEISQLRSLTVLDATSNELTSLPPELGVLCKLKELLLFDNHLTTLPTALGTLYQLETLGIDGNPINDQYRKILAEDGTTALITHLRDMHPAGPSPPERQWIEIESDGPSPSAGKQETFTVLTYNILCEQFAPGSTYSYTPSWALDWSYRKVSLLGEIVTASADIVCLQEISVEQYADYFHPQLKREGYEGSHYPRSRARNMSADEAKLIDGCAIFWKVDRFNLVETQVVEFNQVALQKADMRTDDMFNRVMSRDNIAVVASLEFIASGARLLVANSHIYWDHRYRDVKLVQIGMLMEELEKITERFSQLPPKLSTDPEYNNGQVPTYDRTEKGRDIPLIMCVDLNSLAGSAVYDYLSTGELAPDHEDFMSHTYGPYTAKGLRHRLGLRSSSASIGEMRMTNFTPTFDAAIDYIFYTPKSIKATSVLGDIPRSYLDTCVGFPNAHFPSDHIPVFAQFRIKGRPGPLSTAAKVNGYDI